MPRNMLIRHLSLAIVAIAALVALEPALAFDPQPDPPALPGWDTILRLWRLLVVR